MASHEIIPTPWSYRLQWFSTRVLPICGFFAAVMVTGGLWQHKILMPNAVGEVEALRMDVASGLDGLLVDLPRVDSSRLSLFDHVAKGDVVARLDDRPVRAELATMSAEIARLTAEVQAEAERVRRGNRTDRLQHNRERMRLVWQLEQMRLTRLDRRVQIAVDRVEKERLEVQLKYMEPLEPGGFISPDLIDNTRLLREMVVKRLETNQISLLEVEKQLETSKQRWELMSESEKADATVMVAPFQAAIKTEEARIEQLQIKSRRLSLWTPTAGTVVAIYKHPGQSVLAGDPILTIASDHGRYIVSYVKSERVRVQPGDSVTIRSRRFGSKRETAIVQRVGPQVEPLPPHHLMDPSRPEWGLPVRITMPVGLAARPGELVYLTFPRTL